MKNVVAIVGCGLIGYRRANVIKNLGGEIYACCDLDINRCNTFFSKFNCKIKKNNSNDIAFDEHISIVIIATTHNQLYPIAKKCIENGKHVLIEKPGSINSNQLKKILLLSKKYKKHVRIGYNSEYLDSVQRIKSIVKNNKKLGKLNYIRAVYGHGGRLGYDKEWRASKKLSGGGELIDQGSHLLHLSNLFTRSIFKVKGVELGRYFWNMEVEDNVFLLLKNRENVVISLHASWTEWKNKFNFEIFFQNAKLEISGRGASYGKENLIYYQMTEKMGPPKVKKWNYSIDNSWKNEWRCFLKDIKSKKSDYRSLNESIAVLKVIETAYRLSK